MEWLNDLLRREARLRRRVAELSAGGNEPRTREESFRKTLRPEVEAIQAALDDYLCGRSETEAAWMSYEVQLYLPIFCHLRSIYASQLASKS